MSMTRLYHIMNYEITYAKITSRSNKSVKFKSVERLVYLPD